MIAFIEVLTVQVWKPSVNFIANYKCVVYSLSDLI